MEKEKPFCLFCDVDNVTPIPDLLELNEQAKDLYYQYHTAMHTVYQLKRDIEEIAYKNTDYSNKELADLKKQRFELSVRNVEKYLIDHVLSIHARINKN